MCSSLARVTCGTSEVLLAGGQVLFGESLVLTRLKMSEIILTGRKTQITEFFLCVCVCFFNVHLQPSDRMSRKRANRLDRIRIKKTYTVCILFSVSFCLL